jgi:hypothetical protein
MSFFPLDQAVNDAARKGSNKQTHFDTRNSPSARCDMLCDMLGVTMDTVIDNGKFLHFVSSG